ncbi:MAG: hypothetical protein AAFZ07_16525 [Actinomycetota bacterium]
MAQLLTIRTKPAHLIGRGSATAIIVDVKDDLGQRAKPLADGVADLVATAVQRGGATVAGRIEATPDAPLAVVDVDGDHDDALVGRYLALELGARLGIEVPA